MTEFDSISDVPVNSEFKNELRKAGASEILIEVISLDELPQGVDRNSAKQEVQKYAFWSGEISEETFRKYKSYGGGFFTSLWEGDMDMITATADSNNQKILQQINVLQTA